MPVKRKPGRKKSNKAKKSRKIYLLRLYVVGTTPNCVTAYNNLKKICDEYIPKTYRIEIIDLLKLPQLAQTDQILAIPTVIRKLPMPIRRAIGNLSDTENVLIGLDLHPER